MIETARQPAVLFTPSAVHIRARYEAAVLEYCTDHGLKLVGIAGTTGDVERLVVAGAATAVIAPRSNAILAAAVMRAGGALHVLRPTPGAGQLAATVAALLAAGHLDNVAAAALLEVPATAVTPSDDRPDPDRRPRRLGQKPRASA